MSENLQIELENKIDSLKVFISQFDSESVLGWIANDLSLQYAGKDLFNDTKLSSPYKQYMYLIGLIISTDEKSCIEFKEEDLIKAKEMLEEISRLHMLLFLPTEEELESGTLNEIWYESRKVSMPFFLDYFNTTILNYDEQQQVRIKRWFESYNDFFKSNFNFSIDELLGIYNYIVIDLRNSLEKTQQLFRLVETERNQFLEAVEKGISISEAKKIVNTSVVEQFFYSISNMYRISIPQLEEKFESEAIESFLNIFSIKREKRAFKYYTEENPFELAPLLRKGNDYLFCPVYKQLLNAIFIFLYKELEKSDKKDKFYKKRDTEAEKEAEELLKNIFGDEGRYFSSIFETKDSNNEHDLFVIYKDILVIGEVKASKVKEPFRNPDKAYHRIKRDFKSDRGIQKAYDQGLNLKRLILSQEKTPLYDQQGNEVVNINRMDYKKIYIFCITAENYSILATQLSLLLEKPKDEPYPWVCNLYDLENICNAFKYKKWGVNKFLQYIDERTVMHENLLTTDELEICGFYLNKGSLNSIKSRIIKNNGIFLCTPDMSNIFDNIYYEQRGINIKSRQSNEILQHMYKNRNYSDLFNENKSTINKARKRKKKRKIIKASRKKNRKKKK
ncbi:hypothetical protein GMB51_10955 [Turicibacter sanguinis]|nr:hypothetical protein [Turicibacter sanguinis]MTN51410.1 hypothetical protein [Turicibacter sanguinis]MTN54601.1 hypothetical protein [Turicibacter sanguinis]MTN57734.1 hypothetical protein [Turicibacter sanguinis]MTN60756.1 hypothetical protein [Turicibacter sanguinis]